MKIAFTRLSKSNGIPGKGMKRHILWVFTVSAAIILFLGVGGVSGQVVIGEDNASNYDIDWAGNGGFGFSAWNLYDDGGDSGHFLGNSAADGHGDINTGGEAFGMFGNNNQFSHAERSISYWGENAIFSIDIAVRWRDGARGISLYNENGFAQEYEIWNFNISNDGYGDTGWEFRDNIIITFEITQNGDDLGILVTTDGSESDYSTTVTDETLGGFRLYTGGHNLGSEGERNLFANNLKIVVPSIQDVPTGSFVRLDGTINEELTSDLALASLEITNNADFSLGSNTLTIQSGGFFTNNGTFTAGTGKVVFAGAGTVAGTVAFNDVEIRGGVNFGGDASLNGTLSNIGGFADGNALTYNSGSTLRYEKNYDVGSGDQLWFSNTESTGSAQKGIPWDVEIVSGATVQLNDNSPFYMNGSLINNGTFRLGTGNGTFGDIYLRGDFENSGTFNHNSRAVIFNGTAAQEIRGSALTTFAFFNVNEDANVSINPTKRVTVISGMDIQGDLTIKSDATGTGSLIHNTADVTATIERYIPAPTTGSWDDGYGWHLLSAPVTGQDISDFTVETATDYDFYLWDEATDHWINYKDETTTWGDFNTDNVGATHSTDFARGRGYLVAYAEQQTGFKYEGPVNVADVTWTDLSYAGSGSGEVYSKGWHLLGNPFASAISFNQGDWGLTAVSNIVKIWNEAGRAYVDVIPEEHSPRYIIPAAQGFFVQVESGTNSITIPANARVHQPNTWYKNQQATGVFLVAREAEKAGGQEKNILITEGASEGFDFYWDSRFMAGYAPQLFSIFGDEKLSTKQLPAIDEETVIQLGFIKNTVRDFVIELDVARLYPGLDVYLVDKQLGVNVYLNEKPSYAFISEEDDAVNRFELHFSPPQDEDPTNIEDVDAPSVKLWYSNNTLYVNSQEHNTAVEVYDISGRRLQSHTMAAGEHRIELNLPAGAYIVQSSGNSHHETMKIIIQ